VEYTTQLTDSQAEADSAFIWDQLYQYNLQFTDEDRHIWLRIFVRDDKGALIGGLLGETFWGWLYISILWVHADHRHAGLGKQLMAQAEAEAVRRGCRHAYVDTLDFQAPDFYLQLGYTIWGVLEDLPPGHRRIFLRKDLSPATQ
jgi:GNAT superfamily N-acetyltransferase